jgi:hypothetical protein
MGMRLGRMFIQPGAWLGFQGDPARAGNQVFMRRAAGYPYLSSRGKAALTGTSQGLEHMLQ